MSAPAMKPLFLAERITSPFGGFCANGAISAPSSSSTARPSTLVDVPGLSRVSQAMPSASRSTFHAAATGVFIGEPYGESCRWAAGQGVFANGEVADQRTVVGEAHVRDAKVGHLDPVADQNEIELDTRHT